MNVRINGPTLFLDRWQTLELIDAAGAVAAVKSGCLWITLENDRRDIVLATGESWTIDRNGRTLMHAEKPSTVRLSEPLGSRSIWRHRWHAAVNALKQWVSAIPLPERAPYY